MGLIVLIILILLLIGAIPRWPHNASWGYAPVSLMSVLLMVLIIMLLMGYLPTTGRW